MSASFRKFGYNIDPERQSLLANNHFSLRPLGTVGHLPFWRVLLLAWQPIVAFLFTALILIPIDFRKNNESLDMIVYSVGVVILALYPALVVFLLAYGIVTTRVHSRIRWSAVLYWMWWPVAKLLLCVLAVVLGTALGNNVWSKHFQPYSELVKYQSYQQVDPDVVTGVRLQDAGLVLFDSNSTVNRLGAGCHKSGQVYCVAPILGNTGNVPHQDLFMAGVDCCSCPGEFRCGDWSKPAVPGGMRVVDKEDLELFRYAAEDWSAAHNVRLGQPLFLQWVTDPVAEHKAMWTTGQRILCLGLLAGPLLFLTLITALNGLLGLLVEAGYAAPIEAPKQPDVRSWPPVDANKREESENTETGYSPLGPKYVLL